MFERLKRLYKEGRIGEAELNKAVAKGWVTVSQKNEIMGG